jgi:hypothetical protein
VLVDAGPLYAYVDADDQHHDDASLLLLETHPGPLLVPILVVTEATYLLATRLGVEAEVRFLGDLASGAFSMEHVPAGDWLRIAALVATATFRSGPSTPPWSLLPNVSMSPRSPPWPSATSAWSDRGTSRPSACCRRGAEIVRPRTASSRSSCLAQLAGRR